MSIYDPSDYKTGDAVPSNKAMDLNDNAKVFDVFQNSQIPSVKSRLGIDIKTVWQQEQDFISAENARDVKFDSQYIYKNSGLWSDAPDQITDAEKLSYWIFTDGSGYAVKGSVTLPITKPASPVNDENWFVATSVNINQMRSENFYYADLSYQGEWSPNKTILKKSERPNGYALREPSSGKIILPTDKGDDGFTTGENFSDDLANDYWFINPVITADTSPLVATSFYGDDLTKAISKSKNVFINKPVLLSDKCEVKDENITANGVGSLVTVADDKDGIYLPINDNRSSSRQLNNLQMSGFDALGAEHKTRLFVDKGSLGSSYNDLWLQRAYLGLCMERVMELNANSINVQQCNIGFYLSSIGKTGGGATATWLRGMRAQFNNLGGLIYRDDDENPYISHNVNLDGGLLQENRRTGLAVINAGGKNDELTNYVLNSYHIENNKKDDPTSSAEFTYDILNDDRTVKATVGVPMCDVYVNAANLTIKDSKFTVSYDKPIILRNGAVLTLNGVSGFGRPSGYFIYDNNLDDNWQNARSSFIETGDTSLVGTRAAWCQAYGPVNTVSNSLTVGVSNTTLSPYCQNRYPNNPCLPVVDDVSEITRQDFVLDHVNCKKVTMSTSVDSGNNQIVMRNLFQPSDNSASKYDIITFLIYPARDSLWNISRDDGGISSKVKLRGGEWNRIVITSIGRSNTAQRYITLRPATDVSGDNYVTAINTAFGDYSTVSNIYQNGLFNPLGNPTSA